LAVIVLFAIIGEEYMQYIPPPAMLSSLFAIVLLVIVGEEYMQYIPPP
jgi:uncharacterized membrane protein YfcA